MILPGPTAIRDVKADTSRSEDVVLVGPDVGLYRCADGGATYALSGMGEAGAVYLAWSIVQSNRGWMFTAVSPAYDFFLGGTGELYHLSNRGTACEKIPAAGGPFIGGAERP